MRAGNWGWRNGLQTHEVAGKRLLIVGFGRIGQAVCRRARAFGMRVLACDPLVDPAAFERAGAQAATLEELLASADILVHNLRPGVPADMGIEPPMGRAA